MLYFVLIFWTFHVFGACFRMLAVILVTDFLADVHLFCRLVYCFCCPFTRCGERDHLARDCPEGDKKTQCYNCKEMGHIARECPMEQQNLVAASWKSWLNCHLANKSFSASAGIVDLVWFFFFLSVLSLTPPPPLFLKIFFYVCKHNFFCFLFWICSVTWLSVTFVLRSLTRQVFVSTA